MAVILLIVYVCYLIFQLKSHAEMCNTPSQRAPKRKSSQVKQGMSLCGIARIGAGAAAISGGGENQEQLVQDLNAENEDDEIKKPQLTI